MPTLSLQNQRWWRLRYGPAWRYLTASNISQNLWRNRIADPLTLEVSRYLHLLRLGSPYVAAAPLAFPGIARAFELQRNQPLADDLRLMLLGKLDDAEILDRTGIRERDRRRWQRIFFDVDLMQDRLGWHITHIVAREVDAGNLGLANRLHLARCGGPLVARRLLDGPGMVPSDPDEYARYVQTELQIASAGLFLSPPQSRQEMEDLMNHALKLLPISARKEIAELQLKKQLAKNELSILLAKQKVEAPAAKAAAKVKAYADKEARDQELETWHREQQAAQESRLEAERRDRIEQSPFQQLQWATGDEPGSSPIVPASVTPDSQPRLLHRARSVPQPRAQTRRPA